MFFSPVLEGIRQATCFQQVPGVGQRRINRAIGRRLPRLWRPSVGSRTRQKSRYVRRFGIEESVTGSTIDPSLGLPTLSLDDSVHLYSSTADFWHGRVLREAGLEELRMEFRTERREYWVRKIRRNVERDIATTGKLQGLGWKVIRVWESDILRDLDRVAAAVEVELDDECSTTTRHGQLVRVYLPHGVQAR